MEKEKLHRVSVVLPDNLMKSLNRHLLYQSNCEGRRITVSEGIRRAVEECYPVANQMNLFK